MRSLLHDAETQRRGLTTLAKLADGQALGAGLANWARPRSPAPEPPGIHFTTRELQKANVPLPAPKAPRPSLRQAMAPAAAAVAQGAGAVARTVGGGLGAMHAIDALPRIAGKASQDYHNILGAYYQHGGK